MEIKGFGQVEIKNTLQVIAQYKAELDQMKGQQAALTADIAGLSAHIADLEKLANGAYQGRNHYTDEQRADVRRTIRAHIAGHWSTVGDICNILQEHTRRLIEQELKYLYSRGVVLWNGRLGPASRYSANLE